jgi:hypothetical protein
MLGPNWASRPKEVERISYNNPADINGIPVEIFSRKILDSEGSAAEVMRRWQSLRKMATDGSLDSFDEIWAGLTRSARMRWLKEYPQLPSYPRSDLYAWVQDSKLEEQLFMAPLLNIEDLSQDDVLPQLLNWRQSFKLRYFHTHRRSAKFSRIGVM